MHKANWSSKCYGWCCKAIISVGTIFIKVKGLLTAPLSWNDAGKQDFYFCPQKLLSFKHADLVKRAVSEQCKCRRGYCCWWQRQCCKGSRHCSYINFLHFITSAFPFFWRNVCTAIFLLHLHSVHPHSLLRGLNLLPNFQKGGLDKTSTLRGVCWKRGG